MALTDLHKKLWSSMLIEYFEENNRVWGNLAVNKTSEMNNAKQLAMFQARGNASVRDYVDGTDIAAANKTSVEDVVLEMNKQKVTAVEVRDTDQMYSDIDLLSVAVQDAARELAESYNNDVYTELGARVNIAGIGNKITPQVLTVNRSSLDDGAFNATTRASIVKHLLRMPGRFVTRGITDRLTIVANYNVLEALATYFVIDKPNFGTGSMNDAAWMSAVVDAAFGMDIVWDSTNAGSLTADGTGQFPIYVLPSGRALATAYRVIRTREIEENRQFNREVQSLVIYGNKVIDPSVVEEINFTVAA